MLTLRLYILLFPLLLLISFITFAQETENENNSLAKPVFENGQAQIVPAFSNSNAWIKEELWVETNFDSDQDGRLDRMHVFVTRPSQTESEKLKLPIVYQSSPYYGLRLIDMIKKTPEKYFWNVKHELGKSPKIHKQISLKRREKRPFLAMMEDQQWVPRGYITVYSSSPGTGLSDGAPTIGGENESLAPKAVIDWLNGRANGFKTRTGKEKVTAYWSTGKVGMTGTSYDGTLALAAATTGVEGLEAIIPVAAVSSWYHYYRSNGLVRSPEGYLGEDVDVLYDMIHTADKNKRKKNNANIRDAILLKKQDRVTGDFNDFWAGRDYLTKIDNIKTAVLISHGFNDWNVMPEQSFRIYQAVKNKGLPYQLYYHQEGHGGPPPMEMMNRWFTKYLHQIDNKVEDDPKVWIVRENESMPTSYSNYPDEEAKNVSLYLQAGNPSNGTLITENTSKSEKETLTDDFSLSAKELAKNNQSLNRLLYVSPVLQKDVRLSGEATISIRLSSNKTEANLTVYLVSLPSNDETRSPENINIITRGWADPQNHTSINVSKPLEKNKFYDLSFNLIPDDQVIKAGQKIGLMIFSSDKEFTIHPPKGTELTIDLSKTKLNLPIVGGMNAFEAAIK